MIYFFLILWAVLAVVIYLAVKYRNPFKLIMIFGRKGSGKSTFIAKMCYKQLKKNVKSPRSAMLIYSSIPLDDRSMLWDITHISIKIFIPRIYAHTFVIPRRSLIRNLDKLSDEYKEIRLFQPTDIGPYTFPPNSVCHIDEVGMIWDNREFKKFSTLVRDWFKLQRHYHCNVFLYSQTFDIDIKLRNLTDYMYMVKNFANFLSFAHRINRKLVVVEPTGDSEGRIADGYELVGILFQLIGLKVLQFTFIPRWAKYFNSFETPDLPEIPFEYSDQFFS